MLVFCTNGVQLPSKKLTIRTRFSFVFVFIFGQVLQVLSMKNNQLALFMSFCISGYAPLLLSPVRDAAARLPNGEGTRAEICELLKDSQFLAPDVTSAQVRTTLLCV